MENASSLLIFILQDLPNGILGAQFAPTLLFYTFVSKIQNFVELFTSKIKTHSLTFVKACLNSHSYKPFPVSCLNFGHMPKAMAIGPKLWSQQI
jgi:hypothetical protein